MRRKIYVLAILILCFGLALTGCTEENGEEDDNGAPENGEDDDNGVPDNGDDDNGGDDEEYIGNGTEVFSGTWEGQDALGEEQYEGTWEFTVDWENEDVSGWFDGDAEGDDLVGSVSAGEITAQGQAALGYVTWQGTFSPDGSSVSGTWIIEEDGITLYSGTWSGSLDS